MSAIFYGADLPAGGISLDETGPIPAVSIPESLAERLLVELRRGLPTDISLGHVRTTSNAGEGHVAQFSSSGLAFDGRVKPDVVAPGVALETAQPGTNADGSARFGTVNGTSVAAALVAGGAALLAQARDRGGQRQKLRGRNPVRDDAVLRRAADTRAQAGVALGRGQGHEIATPVSCTLL